MPSFSPGHAYGRACSDALKRPAQSACPHVCSLRGSAGTPAAPTSECHEDTDRCETKLQVAVHIVLQCLPPKTNMIVSPESKQSVTPALGPAGLQLNPVVNSRLREPSFCDVSIQALMMDQSRCLNSVPRSIKPIRHEYLFMTDFRCQRRSADIGCAREHAPCVLLSSGQHVLPHALSPKFLFSVQPSHV